VTANQLAPGGVIDPTIYAFNRQPVSVQDAHERSARAQLPADTDQAIVLAVAAFQWAQLPMPATMARRCARLTAAG